MDLILATVKENVSLIALDAESGDIVAVANGEIPRIYLATGAIVDGGFHVGGSMPEALVDINS
ncbi:MAG: hypothetical protein ACI9MJ_000653 [Alphaproteobacteria bacterium]